jgi:hemin uptake protein HemP
MNLQDDNQQKNVVEQLSKTNSDRQSGIRVIESTDLLQGEKSIVIRHAGESYRLLLTRHNRLILQK